VQYYVSEYDQMELRCVDSERENRISYAAVIKEPCDIKSSSHNEYKFCFLIHQTDDKNRALEAITFRNAHCLWVLHDPGLIFVYEAIIFDVEHGSARLTKFTIFRDRLKFLK